MATQHNILSLGNGKPESASITDDATKQTGLKFSMTPYLSPRLTRTATPKVVSASVSPGRYSAAGSPQKTSGATSPTKTQYEVRGSLSSWYPSSQQSSAANSPLGVALCQFALLVLMGKSSFNRQGVIYRMSSLVHFWQT